VRAGRAERIRAATLRTQSRLFRKEVGEDRGVEFRRL